MNMSLCCATGVRDLKVLKTTQSGYEGYLRDQYTLLPETRERMMATSVSATWKVRERWPLTWRCKCSSSAGFAASAAAATAGDSGRALQLQNAACEIQASL